MKFRRYVAAAVLGAALQALLSTPAPAEPTEPPATTQAPPTSTPEPEPARTPEVEATTETPLTPTEPEPDPVTEAPTTEAPPVTVAPTTVKVTKRPVKVTVKPQRSLTRSPAPVTASTSAPARWTPAPSASAKVVVLPRLTRAPFNRPGPVVNRQPVRKTPITPVSVVTSQKPDWTDGVSGFGQPPGERSWAPVFYTLALFGALMILAVLVAFRVYRRRTMREREDVWGSRYYG